MNTRWRDDDDNVKIINLDDEEQPLSTHSRRALQAMGWLKHHDVLSRGVRVVVVLLIVVYAVSLLNSRQKPSLPSDILYSILYTYTGQGASSLPAWTSDGKYLVIVNGDSPNNADVYVWSRATEKLTKTLTLPHLPPNILGTDELSPDGKHLLYASSEGMVAVWNTLSGRETLTYDSHAGNWPTAAWSPDARFVASVSGGGMVSVWNASTGKSIHTYDTQSNSLQGLTWSPDNKLIGTWDNLGTIEVLQTG